MASILKRGSRYRVLIRKNGYPVICRSFASRASAETYAKEMEAQIERGVFKDHSPAESTSLSALISRGAGLIGIRKTDYQSVLSR